MFGNDGGAGDALANPYTQKTFFKRFQMNGYRVNKLRTFSALSLRAELPFRSMVYGLVDTLGLLSSSSANKLYKKYAHKVCLLAPRTAASRSGKSSPRLPPLCNYKGEAQRANEVDRRTYKPWA